MILIVGSSRDDVLFLKSIIKNPVEEVIFSKYTIYTGSIFNQNATILSDVYTSYVSSSIISHLIEKKMITLVILVGRCRALGGSKLQCGDVAISKAFVTMDVDQIENENVQLGQIPGPSVKKFGVATQEAFPQIFNLSMEIINVMNQCFDTVSSAKHYESTYMSNNTVFHSKDQLEYYLKNDTIFGIGDNVVFDSESGGAAVACSLFSIPLIAVKVVESIVGEKVDLDSYVKVLKTYSSVGKAISSFIGEIGRNDVLPTPGGTL